MRVFIATEIRCKRIDGKLYVNDTTYTIIKRYKDAFGSVVFCGRVADANDAGGFVCADDIIDDVFCVSSLVEAFTGKCKKNMTDVIKSCDLVIARVPSMVAIRAAECAKSLKKPCMSVVIGCAWNSYWNHGVAGKILAPVNFITMRKTVKNSKYALYVTNEFLQRRYPCKNYTIGVSDVYIAKSDDSIINNRIKKIENMDTSSITLVTSAAVNVRYKGQEYVIKAIPELQKRGIDAKYVMMGAGDNSYLKNVAKKAGVEDNVIFTGRLNYDDVINKLDECDIYIQPSLQEGLPRAVVEAMSRGCPCIGAKTGGIPELLNYECITKPKSTASIVDAIESICNKEKLKQLAKTNFEKAKEYEKNILDAKRNVFYDEIKNDFIISER